MTFERSLSVSTISSGFESPIRKRTRDDDEESPIKRSQEHQIHSDAHTFTVNMMMEALRRQKESPRIEESSDESEMVASQKPFWPQIVRVKQS